MPQPQQDQNNPPAIADWHRYCAEIVERLPTGVLLWRLEDLSDIKSFRLLGTNTASSRATGFPMQTFVGKLMPEAFPAIFNTPLPRLYFDAIQTGEPQELSELAYGDSHISKAIFSVQAIPLPDQCVLVLFENISERRKLEDALDGALQVLLTNRKQKGS